MPARVTTARAHVDHVIGVTDKVEIVFDHDNRGALGNKAVEHAQQHLNIERMKADRGFVEHEYGIVLHTAHLARKLKTLRLAARKRRRGLTEREIAQAQVVQSPQARLNLLEAQCGVEGLVHTHVHELRQRKQTPVLALAMDMRSRVCITRTATCRADDLDIGQKLHVERY